MEVPPLLPLAQRHLIYWSLMASGRYDFFFPLRSFTYAENVKAFLNRSLSIPLNHDIQIALCPTVSISTLTDIISFPGAAMVKNPPANAGDTGDMGLIPGSGRSPGGGNFQSSSLAWRIPWTREPGKLQSMGLQSGTRLSNWARTHTLMSSGVVNR